MTWQPIETAPKDESMLRLYRTVRAQTLRDIAKETGISHATLMRIEHGGSVRRGHHAEARALVAGLRETTGAAMKPENKRGGLTTGEPLMALRAKDSSSVLAAEAPVSAPPDLERELRIEWWLNHGRNCRPYGDDGEMQCCMLDFKRMPLDELRKHVNNLRLKRMSEAFVGASTDHLT